MPSAERLHDRLCKAIERVSGTADDVTRWTEAREDGSEHNTGCGDSGYDEHGAMPPRTHGPSLDAAGAGRKADVYAQGTFIRRSRRSPKGLLCARHEQRQNRWVKSRARTSIVAMLVIAACTSPHPEPRRTVSTPPADDVRILLSPAPRTCPLGIMRATRLPSSSLDKAADSHLPRWLPEGFGLIGAWGPPSQLGPDFAAQAIWADGQCREVDLTYWNRIEGVHEFPDKPRIGVWFVIADRSGACFNPVLGEARCLDYFAQPDSDGTRVQVAVSMMGLSRSAGDAIVRSIPT
jgi:hypothetical protein